MGWLEAAKAVNFAGLMKGEIADKQPIEQSLKRVQSAVLLALILVTVVATGCSIKRMAVNKLGDALAGGGAVFSSDDDPDLIKDAAPFSLKLMESLLAESPQHRGLLSATASGFTQYGFAFVQQDADEMEEKDLTTAMTMRNRARRLYLRARGYALRGLESSHPGFTNALFKDAKSAVVILKKSDVPLAYWAAASWGAAISIVKDNTDLIADVPTVEALIDRALALDEGYDAGAIHSFLITYEMARQTRQDNPEARAREHFARAIELTGGKQAGPYVNLVEAVVIKKQDKKEFKALLNKALEVDVNAKPEWRLVNMVMQRRARWLLSQMDNLIFSEEK